MVVLTSSDTRRRLANPARLLLRRRAMIYPPTPARIGVNPDAAAPVHAGVNPAAAAPVHAGVNPAAGVDLLETDLVDRILTAWFQTPDQPCVLCDTDDTVAPVNPCGHLVCRACFDGADFSACPICHRRINPDDP